ncbi:hypothetical protein NFI96_007583 [Prochilodus magdalenae]|nr:hypothetical protein NFI96_007583 [Prochilodus magdalenae]
MESEVQTEWSLASEENLAPFSAAVPVCASLWSVPAPGILWTVPGYVGAPVAEQDALAGGYELAAMPVSSEVKEHDTQTEDWTAEKGSNTNDDWVTVMRSIDEYSSRLEMEQESLVKQDEAAQAEHALLMENLKRTIEEKKRQHQVLLDKIDSLHVKLELNSSKTTRKNFTAKLEELTAEKDQLAEGNRRSAQELQEADRKLKQLIEEQNNERLSWEQEIAALQEEKDRLSKQVEEADHSALKDEIAALESERMLAIARVEDWIAEADRYLGNLRLEPTPQRARQRMEWEKNVVMVRNSLTRLQNMYNDNLKLLQDGQQLDSLPPVPMPALPVVPTIELFMAPLLHSVQMPHYSAPTVRIPPPGEFHHPGVPPHRVTPPLSPALPQSLSTPTVTPSHVVRPKPQLTMPTSLPPQGPFRMPFMPSPFPAHSIMPVAAGPFGAPLPAHVSAATAYAAVSTATASGLPAQTTAGGRPHGILSAGPARNSSPQPVPSNPPPAGKLDKLLERLGAQFPQCTRTQLMTVLQQIKSERGTMAGMSIDDVTQQVSQRLAQNDRLAPGPIAPPSGSRGFAGPPGPVQRPSAQPLAVRPPIRVPGGPVYQQTPSQAPPVRKLCLMCQNHVEPGTQYNTNCPHTLHIENIYNIKHMNI